MGGGPPWNDRGAHWLVQAVICLSTSMASRPSTTVSLWASNNPASALSSLSPVVPSQGFSPGLECRLILSPHPPSLPGWLTTHTVMVAGQTAALASSLSRLQGRGMSQTPAPARESPRVAFDLCHKHIPCPYLKAQCSLSKGC